MIGCLRSCLGKVLALALLVTLGAVAWLRGPELMQRFGGVSTRESRQEPSPELAERTLDRFEAFRAGEGGGELRLSEAEISSVLRYALPGLFPPGVVDPTVELRDGHVRLSARVAVADFPDLPSLDEVVGLLPDTVQLEVRGTLTPLEGQRAALHVDRIEASRIPLPPRLIPRILLALGRRDAEDLPPDAMAVPLPEGLRSAYVLRDSLVLVADR